MTYGKICDLVFDLDRSAVRISLQYGRNIHSVKGSVLSPNNIPIYPIYGDQAKGVIGK